MTRDQPKPTPTIFLNNTLQQRIHQPTNSFNPIILPIQKSLAKTKAIQEAALAYKNNNSLSYRKTVKLHGVSYQAVINYCSGKTIPAPDIFIIN